MPKPDPKSVERVQVHRGAQEIGILERTPQGASFKYAESVITTHDQGLAASSTMPVRDRPYEIRGVNLHPFFAGLLPEGLRYRALVASVKTSQDDHFSLLIGAGRETVGDVWVSAPHGLAPPHEVLIGPSAELNFTELLEHSLGLTGVSDPKSIPGVQPKVSDAMISMNVRGKTRGRDSILKLAPPSHPQLVENEAFFMELARVAGLEVAKSRIIHDSAGRTALLVERFDRSSPLPPEALLIERAATFRHQEDACQLLDVYPAEKYRLQLRAIAEALELCTAPIVERLRLLELYAFSYLIANGDLHAKNISVLWSSTKVSLSPAYDLVSTLPYGDDAMALKLNGRDKRIQRKDFIAFGEQLELKPKATEAMLDRLVKKVGPAVERLGEIGLAEKRRAHLEREMLSRLEHVAAG